MAILFSLTLFVSAFLLFLVQPMFAKMILPMLGGAPMVWVTCMVFFQAALLAGYAYAHGLTRRLGVRRQATVHVALVAAAILVLPFGVSSSWLPPLHGAQLPWLLTLLCASIGLPFFALSTSAPLLQEWFADTRHPSARRVSQAQAIAGKSPSVWMLMSRELEDLATLANDPRWEAQPASGTSVWTDDFSNIVGVLTWK